MVAVGGQKQYSSEDDPRGAVSASQQRATELDGELPYYHGEGPLRLELEQWHVVRFASTADSTCTRWPLYGVARMVFSRVG